jgi:hypothetical protein
MKALLLALALGACGGRSEGTALELEPAPCVELEWTPDWCDARRVPQFVMVCDGHERGTVGSDGVWSEAPFPACAPAEHQSDVVAWCCWGRP